jgi:1,5-anhydro-D-fructose reductase (1,5-anhydro-D-mannitol-forming)
MGHSPTESLILCNEQGNAEIDLGDQSNIYGRVIRQFNHAVFGHGQPTATGDDGLRSLAVAQAVRQSTKTGAKVAVQYE